jgi:hypothetical protein
MASTNIWKSNMLRWPGCSSGQLEVSVGESTRMPSFPRMPIILTAAATPVSQCGYGALHAGQRLQSVLILKVHWIRLVRHEPKYG